MPPFADDDPFADGDRRIGHGREVLRAGRQHPLVVLERHAGGHRHHDFVPQRLPQGADDRSDLPGLHGHDHHVGEPDRLRGIAEGPESVRLRIAAQFVVIAGAGPDLFRAHRLCSGKAAGERLRHVSESDKSDLHENCLFAE